MRERVFFDALGMIAQPVAVAKRGVSTTIAGHERIGEAHQRCLQRRVGERLLYGTREVVMFVVCVVAHCPPPPSYPRDAYYSRSSTAPKFLYAKRTSSRLVA